MTYFALFIMLLFLPVLAQAQQVTLEGEATVKYELQQYQKSGIADREFIKKTMHLTATTPLSAKTTLFLRVGHQSYSGDSSEPTKTALDQYGLRWKNSHTTITFGSQETYLGTSGAIFDNTLNVSEGMFQGIDIRNKKGSHAYHLIGGRLDADLFADHRAHPFIGGELARYFGNTRFLVTYLHMPDLPIPADEFRGCSINSPMGKAEWFAEWIRSSASYRNQAFLAGIKYYPTKRQLFKLVAGELSDNSVPAGKSSLGGYDNGIRGFQLTAAHSLTSFNRLAIKYSNVKTITTDIPIQKTEVEFIHLF